MATRPRTNPRKSPTQNRSKVTVDAILGATARILKKEGYDRASTNKIAEAAGVSVGSLYQYFPSKEALVAALIERHTAEMTQLLEATAVALVDAPIPIAVREVIRVMIEIHRIDPALHRVLVEQVPRLGRRHRVEEVTSRSRVLICAYLEQRKTRIRPGNIELAAFLITQVVESIAHGAVLDNPELLQDEALVAETSDLVLRYLLE